MCASSLSLSKRCTNVSSCLYALLGMWSSVLHYAVSLKPDYSLLLVLGLLLSYISGFSLLVLELPKPFQLTA